MPGRRVGKASPLPTLRTGEISKIYPIKTKRYSMFDESRGAWFLLAILFL